MQRAQDAASFMRRLFPHLSRWIRFWGQQASETELFVQLFTMLLQNTTVGSIPSVCDAVQLTTLPMLRHRRSRVLLVLGANDGLLPRFLTPADCLRTRNGRSFAASAWNSAGTERICGP